LKKEEQLIFLTRQVQSLVTQGETLEHALDKVEKMLGSGRQHETNRLRSLLDEGGHQFGTSAREGIYHRLDNLLNIVRENKGDVSKAFLRFSDMFLASGSRSQFKVFEVGGLFTYLVGVVLMAVVCVSIYTIFVLPQFETMFIGEGAELPAFTQFILGSANVLFYPVIALVLIFIGVNFWFLYRARETIHTADHFSPWMMHIPLISNSLGMYNQYISLCFLDVLLFSGLEENVANAVLEKSYEPVVDSNENRRYDSSERKRMKMNLANALKIGTLQQEVIYQRKQLQIQGVFNFEGAKSVISVIAIIFVALVVGSLIIAMYLPIFQMGQIIGG